MPYTAEDVLARDFILRALLVGPAKSGKSTCAALTSPRPIYVLNCDKKGALDSPALVGSDLGMDPSDMFTADDITSTGELNRGLLYIRQNIKHFVPTDDAGVQERGTVVLDNLMSLSRFISKEIEADPSVRSEDPRQFYPELQKRVIGVVSTLMELPTNLVVIAHVEPHESVGDGALGHMLAVQGKTKMEIPAMLQDMFWLQTSVDQTTGQVRREFLLAPQGTWTKGVRSMSGIPRMDADFTKFIQMIEERKNRKAERRAAPAAPAKPKAVQKAAPVEQKQASFGKPVASAKTGGAR